ncbi:hypothetical protein G4B88_012964 [Cannabis sativa]|uniref:Uncharacterized protein n=2 Tax=Cannabis sativa TaxID=3483 RepID=A0A7J6FKK3_CANSA|nr:hypothetical protein G4B88_012964 [Cannabis sativa]
MVFLEGKIRVFIGYIYEY